MRKLTLVTAALSLFITQSSFANDNKMMPPDGPGGDDTMKPCMVIAKACESGGYTREKGKGKTFWMACMKPIIMGEAVAGVSIPASDVKTCRDSKIERMEKELTALKAVK
jgi:hypothetical protein